MQLFYQPELSNGANYLSEEESRHALKVLRINTGSELDLTDGYGSFYKARLTKAHPKKCEFEVTHRTEVPKSPLFRHIAIAPTKNIDRMEWFVEKATEFGIDRITPILCDHSERRLLKIERLRKKAVSAMKQSIKAYLPQIDDLTKFTDLLGIKVDHKFIAHVDDENKTQLKTLIKKTGSHLILIGPEGDFSTRELELALNDGFTKISLGQSRLRTETAGIAAAHLLNLHLEEV